MSLDAALDQALADHQPPAPATIPQSTITTPPRPAAARPTPSRTGPAQPLAARQQLLDVRLNDLTPDPDNPREDVGDVTDLAQSMAATGLLQPVVARRRLADGHLVLVAGHRRLAAAQQLGWNTIPVIVRRDMRPDDVLAAMLVENGQRKDLDPIEEARALGRLQQQTGATSHADLGRRIGRTQVHVSSRLALLALTPEQQEEVRAGQMTVVEATHKGRLASGRVKPKGQDKGWHLGPQHQLADRAKARCRRLAHKMGRTVGGMACGECWESVIRADERQHLHGRSATTGQCSLCSAPYGGAA